MRGNAEPERERALAGGRLRGRPLRLRGVAVTVHGDLRLGTKFAFLSEEAGNPLGLAARFTLNLPTGDADEGAGQGGVAADVSGVLSKWLSNKFVVSGELGYNFRKNPEDPVVAHQKPCSVQMSGSRFAS